MKTFLFVNSVVFIAYTLDCVLNECPSKCVCHGSDLECFGPLPNNVPELYKRVFIHEAELEEILNFSSPGWKKVTYLSINPGVSVFHSKPVLPRTLHNNEFRELKQLRYLQIACKCLSKIEHYAFNGLNRLKMLDLSNNVLLNIKEIAAGISGENILPNLSELFLSNASAIQEDFGKIVIGTEFYKAVKNKPLKVLDLSETENVWFLPKDGYKTAFSSLEKLNLSGAGIAAASALMVFPNIVNTNFSSFKNLKVLDLSYIRRPFDIHNEILERGIYNKNTYHMPLQLEELYYKGNFINPVTFSGTSNGSHICLSHEPGMDEFKTCISGNFNVAKKLVFCENKIRYVNQNLLRPFENLQYIDLSRNEFGRAVAVDGYAMSLLDRLNRLEVLLISHNQISRIPADTFRSSKSLQVLDLSQNKLSSITFDTVHFTSLKILNLAGNEIIYLDAVSISRLDKLLEMSVASETVNRTVIDITLHENPFECSCKSVMFLQWLQTLNETSNYTCLLNSDTVKIDDYALKQAHYLCKMPIVISVFTIMSLAIVILFTVTIYFTVKHRRRLLEERKIQLGIEVYAAQDVEINPPPVFLSFCSDDNNVVLGHIFPQLDAGLKRILNTETCCIATGANDILPGFPIAEEIIRCIEASSVVVFFVTKAFCKEPWCRYETLVAHKDNKPMILLLWEKISPRRMPKVIYKSFKDYTRVHWTVEDGQRVMRPGWNEVCEAIVRLMGDKETEL